LALHNLIFCKVAKLNKTNLGRDGLLKEVIQMCSNEIDASWGEAIRGPKRWK